MKRIAAFMRDKLGVSPEQRLRIESWSEYLTEYGWQVEFYPFESEELHKVFYKSGSHLNKTARLISCYIRQAANVMDYLFIEKPR